MKTTFIYALRDPDTNEIRYIGKADKPSKRLKRHLGLYEPKPTHKTNWIKSLIRAEKKPVLEILEEVSASEWQQAERKWIAHFRNLGTNLTNTADGGEGGKTYTMSDEERKRRSIRGKERMNKVWAEIRAAQDKRPEDELS